VLGIDLSKAGAILLPRSIAVLCMAVTVLRSRSQKNGWDRSSVSTGYRAARRSVI